MSYEIITAKAQQKHRKRVRRRARRQRRHECWKNFCAKCSSAFRNFKEGVKQPFRNMHVRWHEMCARVRDKFTQYLIKRRAKKVAKKLRKHYIRTGEQTFTLKRYELTKYNLAPVLDFLASQRALTYTEKPNQFIITLL